MYIYFFRSKGLVSTTQTTSGTKFQKSKKKMASEVRAFPVFTTAQPTLDGVRPPTPPRNKGGRPRLPAHLQTKALEASRERASRRRAHHNDYIVDNTRRHRKRRKVTSPPLPFVSVTPQHKLSTLLDWHSTCHISYAYDMSPEHLDKEKQLEPEDDYRYLDKPLQSPPRHLDE